MKNTAVISRRIVFSGLITLLVVSANSLLHVNEVEFLTERFGDLAAWELSLFDSMLYAAYLVTGLLWGLVLSRNGKRKPMVLTGAAGSGLMILLLPSVPYYPAALAVRFLQGSFSVMTWQTVMTLILDYSDSTDRGKNMGVYGLFMALSMGLGPVAGGFLAEKGSAAPYYAAFANNLAAFILAAAFLREPDSMKSKPSVLHSLGLLKQKPALLLPAGVNFVDRLHMGFIIFILPLFVSEVLHMSPGIRGMLMGINALSFIILQYPVGRWSDRMGRMSFLIPGSLGFAVVLSFTGFIGSRGLVPLALCFFILGIFSGLTGPPNSALVGDVAGKDENPMAMAFFNLAGNIGMVLGPLLGGYFVHSRGFSAAFLAAGIIEFISLIAVVAGWSAFRKKASTKAAEL